jgi:alkanesulfonate monooxygenase SsuD/methylene tetrahydromethanopterin reductase-like flavin-dependent oxidoreductase (luciferase family)
MMAGATARWPELLAMAQAAEGLGFDSIWVVDHLLFPPREPGAAPVGVWEGWSLLAALAAATRRVELGTFVVCTGFRNPALLAKMADTVEEISGGRLILGLGAGNTEFEHRAFGYPFDYRVSRFEEAVAIIHGLLRTGRVDVDGRYYQARACELRPRGPRPEGPPLVIGTTGARGMRLTAKCADGWNVAWGRANNSPAGVAGFRAALDAACAEEGRDPATLARSAGVLVEVTGSLRYPPGQPGWNPGPNGRPLTGSPEALAEGFRAFASVGVSHLQVWVNPTTVAGLEQLARALEILDRA